MSNICFELGDRHRAGHFGVRLEAFQEVGAGFPGLHRVALDAGVGVLAADTPACVKREQHPLRSVQPAEAVEVGLHAFRIDEQLFDDACHAMQCEIEGDGGIGPDHALDRRVRDIALMPQRDVFHGRQCISAHHAGKAGEVLGQHGIALVRHRRRAFLAGREILFGFQYLGALQVADLGCKPLDRRGDDGQRGKEHRMAVARDDLRRDRLWREAHFGCDVFFNRGIDVGERPDGAGKRAGRDIFAGGNEAGPVAGELSIGLGKLDTERRWLGVDAVAAPDG